MLRRAARNVAVALCLPCVLIAQPARSLDRLLAERVAGYPGNAGVYVKHLTTGEEAGARADAEFHSASVLKLPVLALAMHRVDQGALSLDSRIPITRENKRGGSGVLWMFDDGLQPTLRDVLTQMVVTSDNTATQIAIEQVGGVAKVNEWIAANGKGMELFVDINTAFQRVAEPAFRADVRSSISLNRRYWLGSITPRGIGGLLERMQRCADGTDGATPIASKPRCEEMIGMMRKQLSGASRLPHYLTVPVAHKTGDWPPYLANDVGIIYAKSGPIVIAVLTNNITSQFGEAEDRIAAIARDVVAYFDRKPGNAK